MDTHIHEFADGATLAEKLADQVAHRLAAAIEARGEASLAVSGGSTPKKFFQALSKREIDWDKVTVTLVDERFVPADHPRSNHLLVKDNLLQDKASVIFQHAAFSHSLAEESFSRSRLTRNFLVLQMSRCIELIFTLEK